MKSLNQLLLRILYDAGSECGTSTASDYEYIARRVETEGLSFLTITLPEFGADFQEALDIGQVTSRHFTGFRRRSWSRVPILFQGLMTQVFDQASGRLLDDPDVTCIRWLRQITLMWAKVEAPCSPERVEKALLGYVETDQEVRHNSERLLATEPDRLERFSRIGRTLWAPWFSAVDSSIYDEGVVPRHGPGATADKLRGNAKYKMSVWTERLNAVFPWWENILPSDHPSHLSGWEDVRLLHPGDEMPVKVITVPKTLKTPRIIAVEPSYMQYMQQGILAVMVEQMARFDQVRQLVSFESQEPNQQLARVGSLTGDLATLDLSEASDRVSNEHVRLLLSNHPHLLEAVMATRSQKARVSLGPGKEVTLDLAKFASMGSALCFPFESVVFMTIVFCAVERVQGRPLSKRDVNSLLGSVRTYGDDIICPTRYVPAVIEELEAFGLKVNRRKSFWSGKFRESCGADWYDGEDVTITRLRQFLPDRRADVAELESTVSFRNALFERGGFDETIQFLDEWIERLIPFPIVEKDSVLLGRLSHEPWQATGWDEKLHRPLVKGVARTHRLPASKLDGSAALLKWFLMRGCKPLAEDHLERAGRPVHAALKNRWAPPFSAGLPG